MTQKKARHLAMELSRRIYLGTHGTLKGFGKISRHYSDRWHLKFDVLGEYNINSYHDAWNAPIMQQLRKLYGM